MEQVYALAKTAASRALPEETRREAYADLIGMSKSEDADVKKLVGSFLPACFTEITSLQEQAVDAVYDLCEDGDKSVRMTGYKTFEQISRKANAWVKRNTDVLIQLLQVESPDELAMIRDLLFKHVRISPPSALSVIFDNLCSSEADEQKKDTLLDILEVEGKSWIKTECMPSRPGAEESAAGKLLREGFERILSSSPPPQLVLKVYRLLSPLPFTSAFLPTDILLYQPSTLETYGLALNCDRRPDPRAVIRNWYENGGIVETFATPLDGVRQMCSWVIKWWELETAGGSVKSLDGRTDEGAQKRWRKVEQGIVNNLAVEAIAHWKRGKGTTPFPFLEPLLMALALLTEIPGVEKSQVTRQALEFGRFVLAQQPAKVWGIDAAKKMQENYYEFLSWFQTSLRTSKPARVPTPSPSWETRPMHITPETTALAPPPRSPPTHKPTPGPLPPTRRDFSSARPEPLSASSSSTSDSLTGQDARKRKFAPSAGPVAESSSSSSHRDQQPRKRVAASDMMGDARPASPALPSLLARMSTSSNPSDRDAGKRRSPSPTRRSPAVDAQRPPPPPQRRSTFNIEPPRPSQSEPNRNGHDAGRGKPSVPYSEMPFHPDNIAKNKLAAAQKQAPDLIAPTEVTVAPSKPMGLSIKGRAEVRAPPVPVQEAEMEAVFSLTEPVEGPVQGRREGDGRGGRRRGGGGGGGGGSSGKGREQGRRDEVRRDGGGGGGGSGRSTPTLLDRLG